MSSILRAGSVRRLLPGDLMLLVLLGLLLFAWAPLTYPGYFQVPSGFLPVYALNDLAANPHWGWLPALDHAPDFWRGAGPLPYLLAWPFIALGPLNAVKVVFGLALVTGPLALYLALRRQVGRAGGLVAATLYAYLPFGLASVYLRGALAEVCVLAVIPLLFLATAPHAGHARPARLLAAALIAAAGIWTQAGLAVMALLTFVVALVAVESASRRARAAATALAAGGLLGFLTRLAWHAGSVPAAFGFVDHRVYLFQLWDTGLGYGLSRPGWQDNLSFQVGLVAVGLALLHLFPDAAAVPAPRGRSRFVAVWGGLAALWVLAAVLPLPLGGLLSFPWQVLGLAGFGLCIVAGLAVGRRSALAVAPWPAALVVLAVLGGYASLVPRYTQFQPAAAPLADFRGPQDRIMLLDAAMQGSLSAGQVVSATLTWQALQTPAFDYNLFLHVLDDNGRRWGQADVQPVPDNPMTTWEPGAVLTGTVSVRLSPDLPPGTPVHLALGLYNWQSGARVPNGEVDSVVLPAPVRREGVP